MFAIRFTVHTTTQHTSSQLVFDRDTIIDINQEANWQSMCLNKLLENGRTQSHVYRIGNKVLLKNTKFNNNAYVGPYTMTEVRNNGAVRAHKGNVTDTYNLRNITPFNE